jgi:hypothetical protein
MSKTERCSFCRELFDLREYKELQTSSLNCCHSCWAQMNIYLNQRKFTLLQVEDN